MKDIQHAIVTDNLVVDDSEAVMRMDLAAESDVAKVGYGQDGLGDDVNLLELDLGPAGAVVHTVAVMPRSDGDVDGVACIEALAKMYGSARRNDADDDDSDGDGGEEEDMMDIDNAGAHAPTRLRNVTVQREATPVNEYGGNRELIMGAFPSVFFLGKGIQSTGSVSRRHVRHMLLQFGGHVAANERLLLLLFNQLLRHEAARDVALAVKSHPGRAAEFHRTVNTLAFREALKNAKNKPGKSKEVKDILKQVRPFLQLSGKKVHASTPFLSLLSFLAVLTHAHTHTQYRYPSRWKSAETTSVGSTPWHTDSARWPPSSRSVSMTRTTRLCCG